MRIGTKSLIVVVKGGRGGGRAIRLRGTGAGEKGLDDLFAQHDKGGDGTQSIRRDLVPLRPSNAHHEAFGPQFAEVIAGCQRADPEPDLAYQIAQVEAQRNLGTGDRRLQNRAHAKLVQVDAADPHAPKLGRGGRSSGSSATESCRCMRMHGAT